MASTTMDDKMVDSSQRHRQRNKSTFALELARLRHRSNRRLESRNGETIKETKFHRLAKIGVKTNMTLAKNTQKIKSNYAGKIILSKSTMTNAKIQRICETKMVGYKKVNAIIGELRNASSITAETVETIRSSSIPTSHRLRQINKSIRENKSWIGLGFLLPLRNGGHADD